VILVVVNSMQWTRGLNGAALTKAAFTDLPRGVDLRRHRERPHGRAQPRLAALSGVAVAETREYLWSGGLNRAA
jgi:hypothetical protein